MGAAVWVWLISGQSTAGLQDTPVWLAFFHAVTHGTTEKTTPARKLSSSLGAEEMPECPHGSCFNQQFAKLSAARKHFPRRTCAGQNIGSEDLQGSMTAAPESGRKAKD